MEHINFLPIEALTVGTVIIFAGLFTSLIILDLVFESRTIKRWRGI